MAHETKIAIVVREDLATWQKLNVTAYLASALAAGRDGVIGEPYQDASGRQYLAMFGLPVLVFAASAAELDAARRRCAERGVPVAIFTDELFGTDNDADNRAAVRAVPPDDLSLAGLAVHERRATVDKVLKHLRLHPLTTAALPLLSGATDCSSRGPPSPHARPISPRPVRKSKIDSPC